MRNFAMASNSVIFVQDYLFGKRVAVSRRSLGGVKKRVFDIICSSILILITLPVFIVVAAAIKLCDGGPIFFSHRRVGFSARPFYCLKFRTMAVDADAKLATCLATNRQLAAEWAATRKLKKDPRLIAIGEILRKTSVDELPQLFNILRGEMSLVGPRPVVSDELSYYGGDVNLYLSVKPGLTGAWQITGRNDTSYETRVKLDRDYCTNWSMLADILIVIKTVPVVIFCRGSY
jgi:exopolysaccharide production protein ExoY